MMSGFISSMTRSRRQMLEKYPDSLPLGLRAERSFQMVDPLVSTSSDNGQTRWVRRFTDVPTSSPFTWLLSELECQAFEGWYQQTLKDGAEWFQMRVRSAVGLRLEECHFIRAYSGPTRVAADLWKIEAPLLLRRRPIPVANDGAFPDEILASKIFDKTINWELPQV